MLRTTSNAKVLLIINILMGNHGYSQRKTLQVGEFELKLKTTCSHKNADGSSALGKAIETIEATCVEHGYTTHECSICHSIVKVDNNDELKKHTPTHHVQIDATCTATGKQNTGSAVCAKTLQRR